MGASVTSSQVDFLKSVSEVMPSNTVSGPDPKRRHAQVEYFLHYGTECKRIR